MKSEERRKCIHFQILHSFFHFSFLSHRALRFCRSHSSFLILHSSSNNSFTIPSLFRMKDFMSL